MELLRALCVAACFMLAGGAGSVGINYGRVANDLPSPQEAVQLIRQQGVRKVKLYDTDPSVLAAFAGSGVEVIVALPNEQLRAVALSKAMATQWLSVNVARHLPSTTITAIAVGNEVLSSNNAQWTASLLPAMSNLHAALVDLHLDTAIKISSPHSLAVLSTSFPPSAGAFSSSVASSILRPMLDILAQTGSFVMINAYPFFAYESEPHAISLDYALFGPNPGLRDPNTGLLYTNLFDAQLDAFFSAMARLGHANLSIMVAETGWPSKGDEDEVGAGASNAARYVSNLVRHVASSAGTPLRPGAAIDTYIFALFNEDMKVGPTSERNYGLFYPNKQSVYGLNVMSALAKAGGSSRHGGKEEASAGGHHHHHHHHQRPAATTPSSSSSSSWCVADPAAGPAALQAALDYACAEGGGRADCSMIQPGQVCFNPNTLVAHASFAFNSYFQLNRKASATCDFAGAARLVQQDPSYHGCKYPPSA